MVYYVIKNDFGKKSLRPQLSNIDNFILFLSERRRLFIRYRILCDDVIIIIPVECILEDKITLAQWVLKYLHSTTS